VEPSDKRPRPNFILFITDQHRADFLGCYGHPILRTPHIDSIAMQGTAFDRFYVASPVCMPNRASLMTSRMPSVHGVRHNGVPLSADAVTFVDLMRDAGYATALIGKSHLQNFTGQAPMAQRTDAKLRAPSPALAEAVRHDLADARYAQESPALALGGGYSNLVGIAFRIALQQYPNDAHARPAAAIAAAR